MVDKFLYGEKFKTIRRSALSAVPSASMIEEDFHTFIEGKSRANKILFVAALALLCCFSGSFIEAIGDGFYGWTLRVLLGVLFTLLLLNHLGTKRDLEPISEKNMESLRNSREAHEAIDVYLNHVHQHQRPVFGFELDKLKEHIKLQEHYQKAGYV